MQKKNKLMLAAAIGMVVIVIVSTAVRCSVSHAADDGRDQKEDPTVEQAAETSESETPSDQGGPDDGPDKEADILSVLQGDVWQASAAPAKTIAFRDGSFVESDGSSVMLAAFDVLGAGEADRQRYLDVSIMRDGDQSATTTTIILEEASGALSVASDGFAVEKRYVQGKQAETPVTVAGLRDPYTGLIDGKTGELASSVSEWCVAHAPSATRASFDGEVYLDVNTGRVSATFHLDDAARSIITAVYEGGAFSVLG